MSLPAMHTAIGMGFPFLAGLVRFLKTKRVTSRALLVLVFAMIFCGLWAEVPDMPKFFSHEWSPHNSNYVNLFFFHGLLDKYQAEDRGLLEGGIAIFSMFFLILFVSSKSVMDNQKRIESLKKASLPESALGSYGGIDYKDIVDIHCHVLPQVDDGPESIEESIKMCKRAIELGVVHIVATPHLPWKEDYATDKIIASYNLLKEALEKENFPLKLSLGADIRISWDLVDRLKNLSLLTLADSRYFLLELDDFTVPDGLENFIIKCNSAGFYPVISHPERNIIFQSDLSRLKKIAQLHALIQVSSCSLVGTSGKKTKMTAFEFLKAGLVDIIASDAHSYNVRLEEFKLGLDVASSIIGRDKVINMIKTIPNLVVNNAEIERIKEI